MKHTDKGVLYASKEGWDVIDCEQCGFFHQFPFQKQDYSTKYYEDTKPRFGKEHETDKRWWKSVYKDIFDTLEGYLDKRQRRILDVGAGYMGFCQYAKRRAWNAVGLDPALQSYKRAVELNIDFYRGNYDNNCLHLGIFDVINLYETLEHIISPKRVLSQTHKQLEQNGMVVVTVPNDFNILQKGKDTKHFVTQEHINYFTIESLSRLLQDNGFDILEVHTSFPMELFLFMGIDYTKNDRTGRRVHNYRKKFELNMKKQMPELFRDWSQFWTDKGLGRDITIYARKV